MPAIVLHQWSISPFCRKVRRILEHKGLAFETVDYNGFLARKAGKLTPAGKLPVLDYDGERIQDSSEIAAYLEQKHPDKPIYPRDPSTRAMAAVWEDWADESLYWFEVYFRFMFDDARKKSAALLTEGRSGLERVMIGRVVKRMYGKKLAAQGLGRLSQQQVEQKLLGHVDTLETLLADREWLAGSELSIADIAVASQLHEIVRTSHMADQIKSRKRVTSWLDRA
jgi:glutathione S-transferase